MGNEKGKLLHWNLRGIPFQTDQVYGRQKVIQKELTAVPEEQLEALADKVLYMTCYGKPDLPTWNGRKHGLVFPA